MALVIPAGFAGVELLLRHVSGSHQAEVTFGVDTSGWTGSNQEMADGITEVWGNHWAAITDAGVAIGPTILHIGDASPPYLQVDGSDFEPGQRTGEVLPSNCAALMKKVSAQPGRGGRGRNYVPWVILESTVDDVGNLSGGAQTELETAADGWLGDMNAGTTLTDPLQVVILHDSAAGTAADAPAIVTAVSVDILIATQRRRLGR